MMRKPLLIGMACGGALGCSSGIDLPDSDPTFSLPATTTTNDDGATTDDSVDPTVVEQTDAASGDDTSSPPTTGLDSSSSGGPGTTCGNESIEGDEACDGSDLGGATCTSEGFDGGTLACAADCSGFDTRGCTLASCGDGLVEGVEICDGAELGGATCMSEGFDGGMLACADDCMGFDTAGCSNGGMLLTVRTTDEMLRAFDPSTLVFTDVGLLGVAFDFGEVAYDTTTATLWMIDGRPAEALYTVNLATGSASLVGVHGIEDLFGLAHDPATNTLYGSGESPSGFYSMNTTTGAASFIGDPALAADGLTYDSTRDQIVALAAGGGQLYSIDRTTGTATMLSSEGFINNCGLGYDPILDVYWAIDYSGDLYTYDPNAAYTRTLELSGLGAHDGLTYVPGFTP